VTGRASLRLGVPIAAAAGWVLTLEGEWQHGTLEFQTYAQTRQRMSFSQRYQGGMSGSPILDAAGRAVGLAITCGASDDSPRACFDPVITKCLPVWLVERLAVASGE